MEQVRVWLKIGGRNPKWGCTIRTLSQPLYEALSSAEEMII